MKTTTEQLSFNFALVPLKKALPPVVEHFVQIKVKLGTDVMIALVPEWVSERGRSFVRGWLKAREMLK